MSDKLNTEVSSPQINSKEIEMKSDNLYTVSSSPHVNQKKPLAL